MSGGVNCGASSHHPRKRRLVDGPRCDNGRAVVADQVDVPTPP
jgi:hypothetical protein